MVPGIVHQNLPHGSRSNCKKVCAVLPLRLGLPGKLQVSLIDQCSRLQCVSGALTSKQMCSQSAEVLIDQRRQTVEGALISLAPASQHLSDLRDRQFSHLRTPEKPTRMDAGILASIFRRVHLNCAIRDGGFSSPLDTYMVIRKY